MNTQKPWLTLNERAILSAQYDVQLQEQLGDALQESLQQSEHAQIGSQTKQGAALMFDLFRWIFCSPPGQPEPLLQQVMVPVSQTKTNSDELHPSVSLTWGAVEINPGDPESMQPRLRAENTLL